jgi:D-glycero-D-manno-heptose 1,7-bisphosphate phosphatase
MKKNKVLFLDRDGVINHDPGDYTYSLSEFFILPTVIPALQLAQTKGYKIILITNQGGVAKGLYTQETVEEIHTHFKKTCADAGVIIDHVFYSTDHPEVGNSISRKPHSLMVERAIQRFNVDVENSVMIGDRDRDVQCAEGAGVRGIKIQVNSDLLDAVHTLD